MSDFEAPKTPVRPQTPLEKEIARMEVLYDSFSQDLLTVGVTQEQIDRAFNHTETRIRKEFAERDNADPLNVFQTIFRKLGDALPDQDKLLEQYFYSVNGNRASISRTKETREVYGKRVYRKGMEQETIGGGLPVIPLLWSTEFNGKIVSPSLALQARFLEELGVLKPGQDLEEFRLSLDTGKLPMKQFGDSGVGIEQTNDGYWVTGIETNIPGVELRMPKTRTDVIEAVLLPEAFRKVQPAR